MSLQKFPLPEQTLGLALPDVLIFFTTQTVRTPETYAPGCLLSLGAVACTASGEPFPGGSATFRQNFVPKVEMNAPAEEFWNTHEEAYLLNTQNAFNQKDGLIRFINWYSSIYMFAINQNSYYAEPHLISAPHGFHGQVLLDALLNEQIDTPQSLSLLKWANAATLLATHTGAKVTEAEPCLTHHLPHTPSYVPDLDAAYLKSAFFKARAELLPRLSPAA